MSGHHHLSLKVLLGTALALGVLTVLTVSVAMIHIPSPFNIVVAIAIAAVKAYLVVMYFMNLRNDSKFNLLSFGFSILFSLVFALFFMPIKDGQSDSQYYTIKEKVFDFISNLSIPINTDLLAIITATLTIVILISGYFIFEEHKSLQ